MTDLTTDYDGAWQEALEQYFPGFMAFFLPAVHADIDWARGHRFLNQELRQVAQEAELGRRRVDKLVEVMRRDGSERWVHIHIEIQSQHDAQFAERMYVYNYRIYDRFRRQPYSVAVLADESPTWRPNHFGEAVWNCLATIRFPVIKLSDYQAQWALLEASTNPFATVVMAHLKTQETQGSPADRIQWKWVFTRRLYELGLSREEIIRLYRIIDWLMRLPRELERQYVQAIETYEQEQAVTFITSAERIGEERGFQKGVQEGKQEGLQEGLSAAITLGLELKFGAAGLALLPSLTQITDLARLQAIYAGLKGNATLDELQQLAGQA